MHAVVGGLVCVVDVVVVEDVFVEVLGGLEVVVGVHGGGLGVGVHVGGVVVLEVVVLGVVGVREDAVVAVGVVL